MSLYVKKIVEVKDHNCSILIVSHLYNANFCRAMLCISAAYAVMRCLSVRLSRLWIVSKRINISSEFFHRRVAKPF